MKKKKNQQTGEGIIILKPGPCPLTVSDWMNYLISLKSVYENRLNHFNSQKNSVMTVSAGIGALFAALYVPQALKSENPFELPLIIGTILTFIIIFEIIMTKFYGKIIDHQGMCRDGIKDIIAAIVCGTLVESDMIRLYFYQKCDELGEKADKLIKELELDKKSF